jgi:hypothetical protein
VGVVMDEGIERWYVHQDSGNEKKMRRWEEYRVHRANRKSGAGKRVSPAPRRRRRSGAERWGSTIGVERVRRTSLHTTLTLGNTRKAVACRLHALLTLVKSADVLGTQRVRI